MTAATSTISSAVHPRERSFAGRRQALQDRARPRSRPPGAPRACSRCSPRRGRGRPARWRVPATGAARRLATPRSSGTSAASTCSSPSNAKSGACVAAGARTRAPSPCRPSCERAPLRREREQRHARLRVRSSRAEARRRPGRDVGQLLGVGIGNQRRSRRTPARRPPPASARAGPSGRTTTRSRPVRRRPDHPQRRAQRVRRRVHGARHATRRPAPPAPSPPRSRPGRRATPRPPAGRSRIRNEAAPDAWSGPSIGMPARSIPRPAAAFRTSCRGPTRIGTDDSLVLEPPDGPQACGARSPRGRRCGGGGPWRGRRWSRRPVIGGRSYQSAAD